MAHKLRFMLVAAWITAVATAGLALFATVTAVLAYRAFRAQSKEVIDQAEMLDVMRRQAEEQSKINELLADDLRGSVEERIRLLRVAEREQADLIGFRLASTEFPEFSLEDVAGFVVVPGVAISKR
jgi:hypothetical protein